MPHSLTADIKWARFTAALAAGNAPLCFMATILKHAHYDDAIHPCGSVSWQSLSHTGWQWNAVQCVASNVAASLLPEDVSFNRLRWFQFIFCLHSFSLLVFLFSSADYDYCSATHLFSITRSLNTNSSSQSQFSLPVSVVVVVHICRPLQ